GSAKAIDPADISAFTRYAEEHDITRILAHAPYTLNPAAADDRVREFALMTFADDLARMENTPNQMYNFHPGSHVKQGVEVGIEKVSGLLNQVLNESQTTTVLLETMAGKGTELGGTFEELAAIIKRINFTDRVGVCLDTCHVWDGGYDIVANLDGVLEQFDTIIGLNRLKAIHLNDSLNPCGAHKDRHAGIGDGQIGFDGLAAVMNHPTLRELPFFLETPHDLAGHAEEIVRLRAAYQG
ncbi:MAG: deoxyribonuclease IV, partial [Raoultibacter sp.]